MPQMLRRQIRGNQQFSDVRWPSSILFGVGISIDAGSGVRRRRKYFRKTVPKLEFDNVA
jgi:hypothetical protein